MTTTLIQPSFSTEVVEFRGFKITIVGMNFTENPCADDATFVRLVDSENRAYSNVNMLRAHDYSSLSYYLCNSPGYDAWLASPQKETAYGRHGKFLIEIAQTPELLVFTVDTDECQAILTFRRMHECEFLK